MPMIAISFDGRVRADRLIGFYVPSSVNPGSVCSFSVTMTQPNGSGGNTLIKMFAFTATIPPDRKVIFSVPSDVPLGTYRFTILCTILSTAKMVRAAKATVSTVDTTSAMSPDGTAIEEAHAIAEINGDEPEPEEAQATAD